MSASKWPTREEWARNSRTFYYDHLDDVRVSDKVADYASEAETNAVIAKLGELWRDLDRQMKTAESADIERIRDRRRRINSVLKTMRAGDLPHPCYCQGVPAEILAPVSGPRAMAYEAAVEAKRQEIAATPIDDAAWEKELQRRAELERWHPDWFK